MFKGRKNRHLFILLVGLIALFYFVWSKSGLVTSHPERAVKSSKLKTLKLIEEKIQLEKQKESEENTSGKLSAGENDKKKTTEISCWEDIRSQFQASTDYLSDSRHRMDQVVGSWFYADTDTRSENLRETSAPGMFFLALAQAGLLDGLKMERNDEAALSLLEQVVAVDPYNSAAFLYAAIIENRRGDDKRAEELLEEASQSRYFDSYIKKFTFSLYDGVKNPSDFLVANEVWSAAPIPDYLALEQLLVITNKSQFAKQLTKDGLRDDRKRVTDLSWIPIEYAMGKKLLDIYGEGFEVPKYRDLIRKKSRPLEETTERAVSKLDSTCELGSIQSEVKEIRRYLDQVRIKGI